MSFVLSIFIIGYVIVIIELKIIGRNFKYQIAMFLDDDSKSLSKVFYCIGYIRLDPYLQ